MSEHLAKFTRIRQGSGPYATDRVPDRVPNTRKRKSAATQIPSERPLTCDFHCRADRI